MQTIQPGSPPHGIGLPKQAMWAKHANHQLLLKGSLNALIFSGIIFLGPFLGPFFTFLFLDMLLSVYLFTLFRGRWRKLFLIHPVVVYLTGFGFEIPYTEIGTGYTYIFTFDRYVDPFTLSVDWKQAIFDIFLSQERASYYGFSSVYIGTIPILLFPK